MDDRQKQPRSMLPLRPLIALKSTSCAVLANSIKPFQMLSGGLKNLSPDVVKLWFELEEPSVFYHYCLWTSKNGRKSRGYNGG